MLSPIGTDNVVKDLGRSDMAGYALGTVLVVAQAIEIYESFSVVRSLCLLIAIFIQNVMSGLVNLGRGFFHTINDFRDRKFYKPWGRTEPMIIHSKEHMQELSEALELSQRAIYADIFGFQHNMSHTEIEMDPNEQSAARYRLFARAIKLIGGSQIATLQPFLQASLAKTVEEAMESHKAVDGWTTMKLAPIMRDSVSGMLKVYLFGNILSQESTFASALDRWYQDVVSYMGLLQIVPGFLKFFVHSAITHNGRALNVLFDRMNSAIDPEKPDWSEDESLKSMTLLYNMVESSKESSYWTNTLLIQAMIGIWFAAAHQPWINLHFVILELCYRPEEATAIREEINRQDSLDYNRISKLPLLDSFIKEAVRLNPLDKMSIRRKALKDFQFSNGGPFVPAGRTACVSGWNIMHDERNYPRANTFDSSRYIQEQHSDTGSRMDGGSMKGTMWTDASRDYPVWGLGSKVCPGRFHAALVIKMAIVHILKQYDLRLEEPHSAHRWFWESWQMPYQSTKVSFRKRE